MLEYQQHMAWKSAQRKTKKITQMLLLSLVGSLLSRIGRWTNINLKELLSCCRTCTKNSDDVFNHLKNLKRVSNSCFMRTFDTEEMHPNVRIEEGLSFLTLDLDAFTFKVQPQCPMKQ